MEALKRLLPAIAIIVISVTLWIDYLHHKIEKGNFNKLYLEAKRSDSLHWEYVKVAETHIELLKRKNKRLEAQLTSETK